MQDRLTHKCPIYFCKKYVPLKGFVEHDAAPLPLNSRASWTILLERAIWPRGHHGHGHSACRHRILTGTAAHCCLLVVCPICSFRDIMITKTLLPHAGRSFIRRFSISEREYGRAILDWRIPAIMETAEGMGRLVACVGEMRTELLINSNATLRCSRIRRVEAASPTDLEAVPTIFTHVWDDLAHPVRCAPWQKIAVENELD